MRNLNRRCMQMKKVGNADRDGKNVIEAMNPTLDNAF